MIMNWWDLLGDPPWPQINGGSIIDGYFYSSGRYFHVYKLMQWVALRNQLLFELDNHLTHSVLNVRPVSFKIYASTYYQRYLFLKRMLKKIYQTIWDYIRRLVQFTDPLIFRICYLFIQWYLLPITSNFCAPPQRRWHFRRGAHFVFKRDLRGVWKVFQTIITLTGDYYAINQNFSTLTKKPLIGCTSHKLNLKVDWWFDEWMGKLDSLKLFLVCAQSCQAWKIWKILSGYANWPDPERFSRTKCDGQVKFKFSNGMFTLNHSVSSPNSFTGICQQPLCPVSSNLQWHNVEISKAFQ